MNGGEKIGVGGKEIVQINGITFVKTKIDGGREVFFLPEQYEKYFTEGHAFYSLDDEFWIDGNTRVPEEEFWRRLKLRGFE